MLSRTFTVGVGASLLLIAAACAHAADNPSYAVTATAHQLRGEQIVSDIQIVADPGTDHMKNVAVPRVTMLNGTVAIVQIGQQEPLQGNNGKATTAFTGIRISVTHALKSHEVVVVTQIVEQDKNIWVDTQRVLITPEP